MHVKVASWSQILGRNFTHGGGGRGRGSPPGLAGVWLGMIMMKYFHIDLGTAASPSPPPSGCLKASPPRPLLLP